MGNSPPGKPIVSPVPGAPPGSTCAGYLGDWNDGYCHDQLNNAACGYDGGDCCPSTCGVGNPFYLCYTTDLDDCVDPNAEENGGLKVQANFVDTLEITVTGAEPNSTVFVWTGLEINPFTIPDDKDTCPGLELDVEFGARIPESFIADNNGQVRVKKSDTLGRNLGMTNPADVCSNLLQAFETSSCKKSNIAFIQEFRPTLWNSDSCYDHGFDWCTNFFCPEPIEYRNCCQSYQYYCDVAVGCSADHNGTPDDTTGPDQCRAYWLNNDYFYSDLN